MDVALLMLVAVGTAVVLCLIALVLFLRLGLLPQPLETSWLRIFLRGRDPGQEQLNEIKIEGEERQLNYLPQYVARHWRALVVSSLAGIVVDAALIPIVGQLPITEKLKDPGGETFAGILAAASALVVLSTPTVYGYLKKYRRSIDLPIERPQPIDLWAVGITTALLFLLSAPVWRSAVPRIHAGLLVIAAGLGIWFVAVVIASRSPRRLGSGPVEGRFKPYSDEPINRESDDLLGRAEFAEGLYRQLEALPFPESFVIGLYAGWGEGKTSVLNLLARRVEANDRLILVKVNPWFFPSEIALIRNFYDSVEASLQQRYSLPGLRAFLDRYENLLTLGLGFEAFRLKLRARESAEELREELQKRLEALPSRLVILVDDVDRLQPAETMAVLKLCRLSARLRNTVFMLSLDPAVVRQLIREAKADPEYLDKIVQKPIPLPPAQQDAIDRYLLFSDSKTGHRSAIDVLLDEMGVDEDERRAFDARFVSIYQTHLRRFFRTLRQAKRYLNGLQSTVPPLVGEVNLGDAFLLEFIQVFFPEVYQDIWANRWMYLPAWTTELMMESPLRFEEENEKAGRVRVHIEAMLASLKERDRAVVQAVLTDLFFIEVRNAYAKTRISHADDREERAEKRLTHPECFVRYFLLRAPSGEIADSEVEALIDGWRGVEGEDLALRVIADLAVKQEAGLLGEVIRKVRIFLDRVDEEHAPGIVRGLYGLVPRLQIPTAMTFLSDYDQVEALVLRLIDGRVAEQEVEPLLEEVVGRVEELHFAVLVVLSVHRAGSGSLFRIRERASLQSLRRVAAARLRAHYIAGRRDIFEERPAREWALILYQWGTDWMTNIGEHRDEVRAYIRSLWREEPRYLGRILMQFTEDWGDKHRAFRLEDFGKLFDSAEVMDDIRTLGREAVAASHESKEAVELFEAALRQRKG